MKKSTVILTIIASISTIIGGVLLAIGLTNIRKNDKQIIHEFEITDSFSNFRIDIETADVDFKLSDDGGYKVISYDREKEYHNVYVNEDTLIINSVDELKWYERLNFGIYNKMKIEIYLPEDTYGNISIDASTSDITINNSFLFNNIDIKLSTGDTYICSNVINNINVTSTTGNVKLENMEANDVSIITSTGHIHLDTVTIIGNLTTKCSTGDLYVRESLIAKDVKANTSTGDIDLINFDASNIDVETSTGDVTMMLTSEKVYHVSTSTGHINIPQDGEGGNCNIKTSTGNIKVSIV